MGVGAADDRRPTQAKHGRGDFFQGRATVTVQKGDVDLFRVGLMTPCPAKYRWDDAGSLFRAHAVGRQERG